MDRVLAHKIKKDFKHNKSFKKYWISQSIENKWLFMSVEEIFSGFVPTILSVRSVVSAKLTSKTGYRGLSPHCKPSLFKDLTGRGKEICFSNK